MLKENIREEQPEQKGTKEEHSEFQPPKTFFKRKTKICFVVFCFFYLNALIGYTMYRLWENKTLPQILVVSFVAVVFNFALIACLIHLLRNKPMIVADVSDLLREIDCPNAYPVEIKKEDAVEEDLLEDVIAEKGSYEEIYNPQGQVKSLSLADACTQFCAYSATRGLLVDYSTARVFFSALTTTKLILIRSIQENLAKKFITIAKEYFSNQTPLIFIDSQMMTNRQFLNHSLFRQAVEEANAFPDRITLAVLDGMSMSQMDKIFAPMMPFIGKVEKTWPMSGEMTIPQNFWMVALTEENEYSKDLAMNTLTLELDGRFAEETEFTEELKLLSYSNLVDNLVVDDDFLYSISEEDWKKLDELEDYLQRYARFHLENRSTNQMEDFAFAYMIAGGEEKDALDGVLACKILPPLLQNSELTSMEKEDNLSAKIEELFDPDHLQHSRKVLKRVQKKAEGLKNDVV